MILRKQFLQHVGQTSPSPMLIEVARAEGSFFYTPEGKRYFDLVAGVSVSNVGHANPDVVRAVQEQAAQYMHVMVYGEMVERPHVKTFSPIKYYFFVYFYSKREGMETLPYICIF